MVEKDLNTQFAVNDSDIPVTLKQGQGHQTWYELLGSKQGYNNAKFENPCLKLNSVHDKANNYNKGFYQIRRHVSYLF